MKIAVICHYFYPEIGAPSARIFEMAKCWVSDGHEVSIITCFPNHPTGIIPNRYKGKAFSLEFIEGIKVYRNYVYATPNEGFLKKTLGHLSFMFSSVLLSLFRIDKPDVIIVSSPTLFSVISGYIFSLFKHTPFVFEVRDLWPDAIIKLGVLKNKVLIKSLEWLEIFLYRRSAKIVVVTEAFKKQIAEKGIDDNKIEVITNGVDLTIFNKSLLQPNQTLRSEFGWGSKRILLYVGAHGMSQGLSTLLELAKRMEENKDVLFVFVGEGAEKQKLQDLALELKLQNVQFISSQSKDRIPLFYSIAEISFVPLRNLPMFEAYIPSKMFEILGSGCPIIASITGESAGILIKSEGAIIVSPENVDELQAAAVQLIEDPLLREKLSENGYQFVKANYSRSALAEQYIRILQGIVRRVTK